MILNSVTRESRKFNKSKPTMLGNVVPRCRIRLATSFRISQQILYSARLDGVGVLGSGLVISFEATLVVSPGSPCSRPLRANENGAAPSPPREEQWSLNWNCWICTGGKLRSSQKTATNGVILFLPYAPLGAKENDDKCWMVMNPFNWGLRVLLLSTRGGRFLWI